MRIKLIWLFQRGSESFSEEKKKKNIEEKQSKEQHVDGDNIYYNARAMHILIIWHPLSVYTMPSHV